MSTNLTIPQRPIAASPATSSPADSKRRHEPSDDELVSAAIEQLESTPSGRELAQLLRDRRNQVVVLHEPGGVLPPGAGGRWDPGSRRLYILRDELAHPAGATLLAHEAVHMRDLPTRLHLVGASAIGIARAGVDMLVAPLQLRNPVTAAIDGVRGAVSIGAEVDAYHEQAKVARELGFRSDQLHAPDGTPRSREELRAGLLANELYETPVLARAALGTGFAWLGGRLTAQAVNAVASRVAPSSWLARHPGIVTAGALATWGALLVQDQLAARR